MTTDTGAADHAALDALIAEVSAQEERLQFTTFSPDDAWMLGSSLRDLALTRDLAITIDIALGEQRLFHSALPGTSAHNGAWIERKKRTVREFGTSSYLVGLKARRGGTAFEDFPWIDPLVYAGHGGGFPLTIRGTGVVGTITVSGQPQEVDHALIIEALTAYLGS